MVLAPQTLVQDRYRIVRLIGQGGMGAVYKAMDERLAHPVALKQTLLQNEQRSSAFEREARILARLRHPALVRVTDHFTNSEGQFLVMDYINGEDLATMLKQRGVPFDCATVLEWADQLLNALDYLHNEQPPIIHRDIKPQNLKCSLQGQLILLDFGLAKGWSGSEKHIMTEKSLFGYTPQYAPFEQIQGLGTDARSDLFALAATLYHLLGGNPPVNAVQRTNAVLQNKTDPLPLLHDINPLVPLAVSQIIHQALRLERRNRPASAAVLRGFCAQSALRWRLLCSRSYLQRKRNGPASKQLPTWKRILRWAKIPTTLPTQSRHLKHYNVEARFFAQHYFNATPLHAIIMSTDTKHRRRSRLVRMFC